MEKKFVNRAIHIKGALEPFIKRLDADLELESITTTDHVNETTLTFLGDSKRGFRSITRITLPTDIFHGDVFKFNDLVKESVESAKGGHRIDNEMMDIIAHFQREPGYKIFHGMTDARKELLKLKAEFPGYIDPNDQFENHFNEIEEDYKKLKKEKQRKIQTLKEKRSRLKSAIAVSIN